MFDDEDDTPECPLCLDPLEFDDVSFFPCTCGYQVCRFCWHRIRTDENGLCPQCRKPYSEDPVRFKPLSNEEIQKLKKDRDRRAKEKKGNALDSRKHLANLRVVQPNLLFVVGLTQRMADAEVLKRSENFGRFGKINKLSVTVTSPSNNSSSSSTAQTTNRFSATCHVTYAKAEDALRALLFLDQSQLDSRTLRISIGTTKYCSNFVKGNTCHRKDCTYLHEVGPSDASFTKEAMQDGKHVEYERRLLLDFVARNPSLAQQVDISKISNKSLPSQGSNHHSNHNGNEASNQVYSMLNGGSDHGPRGLQQQQTSSAYIAGKNGPQITSKSHQPRSSAASSVANSGHITSSSRKCATTSAASNPALRNRSGSASGKQRSTVQNKNASKTKDDASIASSSNPTNHRSSRSNRNGVVSKQTANIPKSSQNQPYQNDSKQNQNHRVVKTTRLTTPDEPVWWGLEEGGSNADLVLSSSASNSPTNGTRLSPPSNTGVELPNAPHSSSAPSPLLQQGTDSGFVSSSSSTGGSEASSIGLSAANPQNAPVSVNDVSSCNGGGTLVSLFSTGVPSQCENQDSLLFGNSLAATNLANVDKAIAAILSPSPERVLNQNAQQPQQNSVNSNEIPPARPIDLKDILRSCASLSVPSAAVSSENQQNDVSDCCDDLDVDPMEESIRRLNDLMMAEQRKKASVGNGYGNSYSMFSHAEQSQKSLGYSQPPPVSSVQNGYHGNRMNNQHQQQQQTFHPQMSNYPSISSSSLFASYQQIQQQNSSSSNRGSNANGHAQYMHSQHHHNSTGASWPAYNANANNYNNPSYSQRSYGAVGYGTSSSSSSSANIGESNLANWLLQPSQLQQQPPQNGFSSLPSSQAHGNYGIPQNQTSRPTSNDYMAAVFAAPGKRM